MDRQLEEWIDKKLEPEKDDGLEGKKMSADLLDGLGAEGSIEQMIGDIDNAEIRKILMYELKENLLTREKIKEEISIYYTEIEPRLSDKDFNSLFNLLVSIKRIIPSYILKEFQSREQILAEPDSEVKGLMEISLKHGKLPSLVLKNKNIYKKFAGVKDVESKNIILYYLNLGLSPKLVDDRYEDYLEIRNYEYKSEDLRTFLLGLINGKESDPSIVDDDKVDPSLISFLFDTFKNYTECGDKEKSRIMKIINKPF